MMFQKILGVTLLLMSVQVQAMIDLDGPLKFMDEDGNAVGLMWPDNVQKEILFGLPMHLKVARSARGAEIFNYTEDDDYGFLSIQWQLDLLPKLRLAVDRHYDASDIKPVIKILFPRNVLFNWDPTLTKSYEVEATHNYTDAPLVGGNTLSTRFRIPRRYLKEFVNALTTESGFVNQVAFEFKTGDVSRPTLTQQTSLYLGAMNLCGVLSFAACD